MCSALVQRRQVPKLSRLGWLMGLYAENHARLLRLFAPLDLARGLYRSQAGEGPALYFMVNERHPYTMELGLSYGLTDPVTGLPDPSASLRLYRDARQLEATHCYAGRRWQDAIGLDAPPQRILDHRLQMNTFLGKWLQYLAEQGHGVATLRRVARTVPVTGLPGGARKA
ncbi:DUF1249 domain-containing protein [Thermomonas sp.]|uniref:DUF1249 domain-containing protein n=1 Tax=Thermomonas sp. TaxID=1971895 RepID=UPI001D7D3F9B|nr:DUF1249 domain-containing protein [Thermomonas sp.]MBZ0086987.1 DUF1249 domain-containing protein [Thermomonas sp.]MCO5055722.1 DUF1249 domain-containing protein [Thermomonas sp.]HRO64276.1 DUF1249 domain-containing protein [Thermomonas sp.]